MPTSAMAQTAPSINYTSIDATAEKLVQVGYYASGNKNCTPAPVLTIRMVETPKLGIFTVRRGELTTHQVAGCPSVNIPAQIVFYEARAGTSGTDRVIYQVRSFNGEIGLYDVTIEIKQPVKAGPASSKDKI